MQTEPDNNQDQPETLPAPQDQQSPAEQIPSTPAEAATATPPPAQPPAEDAVSELPDGQIPEVQDLFEDIAIDTSAVDPQIDMGLLEAYLFSTHSPLTAGRLAELFKLESTKPIRKLIRILNEQYEQTRRCFRVEQVAGGFQLLTIPDYHEGLKALIQKDQDSKLTKAALETLAIIAYKQPILRADLESIRGVASGETIRSLMEKHLVKIAGRAEEPGRPILYGTTKRFLEVFGLNSLKDLPQPEALQARAQQLAAAQRLAEVPDEKPEQPGENAIAPPASAAAIPVNEIVPADEQPSEEMETVDPASGIADMDAPDEGHKEPSASSAEELSDDAPAATTSPTNTAPLEELESTDTEGV